MVVEDTDHPNEIIFRREFMGEGSGEEDSVHKKELLLEKYPVGTTNSMMYKLRFIFKFF